MAPRQPDGIPGLWGNQAEVPDLICLHLPQYTCAGKGRVQGQGVDRRGIPQLAQPESKYHNWMHLRSMQ